MAHLWDDYGADFDDFVDYVIEEEDAQVNRAPKRYVRDAQNPFEYYSEIEFKRRFRFTKECAAYYILPLVNDVLQKESRRGLPVSPMLQLLCCLRFYATGSFQMVYGDLLSLSQSTISRIVARVSRLIAEQHRNFIKFPEGASLLATKASFQQLRTVGNVHGIPGIIGALDGTHIRIENIPGRQPYPEVFRNRKTYFSINVQAITGPNMEFFDITARYAGSTHDSTIFRSSRVYAKLSAGQVQGALLADSAYPSSRFVFTPLLNLQNEADERYNAAHKRARNIIERTFGIWKRRFPCLKNGLGNNLPTVSSIIVACAVLHNISLQVHDQLPVDEGIEIPVEEPVPADPAPPQPLEGIAAREALIQRHFT